MADRRFKSRSRSVSVKRRRKYSRSRSTDSRTPSPQLKRGRPYYDDRGRRQYREKRGRPNRWEDDPSEDGYRVHVGDIVKRTSQDEIEDAFRKYGYIKDIFVANTFPQFAIVSYEDKLDAEDAIRELDGNFLNGSKISVSIARPRKRQRDERKMHGSFSCYKCGRSGHIARDCEDRDDYQSRGEGYSRGRDRDRDGWKDRRQEKHYGNGDRGGRPMSCYRCGKTGHMSRDCDNAVDTDSKRRQRSRSYSPRRRKSRSASYSPSAGRKKRSFIDSDSPNGKRNDGYKDEFDDYRRDRKDSRNGRDGKDRKDRDSRENRNDRSRKDSRDSKDYRDDRDDHDDRDDRMEKDNRSSRIDQDEKDDRDDHDDRDDDRDDRNDRDELDDRDERETSMENDQY